VIPAGARWNFSPAALYEAAVLGGEGRVSATGQLVCATGAHTGRSPKDKFIVHDESTRERVAWGAVNQPLSPAHFEALLAEMTSYVGSRAPFVQDRYAGADPAYRLPVRLVTEFAWHSLFGHHLFRAADDVSSASTLAPFTVISAPGFKADPATHGTNSDVCIALSVDRRVALICGTHYAGELKKAIFTVMNYLLPAESVLPMHCSANIGARDDVALFFGLSGTGKTTLSSDGSRRLIGDDEHGWSDSGVFNIEGGCYPKLIGLSAEAEPQIAAAISRFGAVLENVALDEGTRVANLDDARTTENTRGAFPLTHLADAELSARGGHPATIVMLTADAFGVLPPVAALSPEAAAYHFLSGYTAKVAGTERGVSTPTATFSACFGAPFLTLPPRVYADMLAEKIRRHRPRVWLVNTGWTGGPYGVGQRISLAHTRAIVRAALSGELDDVPVRINPVFRLAVPAHCPGVPTALLDPRTTWRTAADYDAQARTLAGMFVDNFRTFEGVTSPAVRAAGPVAAA
jgi:phosphoenolpyruvate carboxykinase (ATP)